MITWSSVLSDELKKLYKQYVRETDSAIDSFLVFDPEVCTPDAQEISGQKSGPLTSIPVAIKDNIAVQGFQLSCGSRILESFKSPYTATAVQSLMSAGACVVGKTNLDEFAMGSSTEHSAFKSTHNPWDVSRVPGGSSGGSAAAVAAGMVPLALGSDTGGSVRQPASLCGVYGLKPTYGAVSRYGLVAYASSLDVIGVLAESMDILEAAFRCISGKDVQDQTTRALPAKSFEHSEQKSARIGIYRDFLNECSTSVRQGYQDTIERLREQGHTIVDVTLPRVDHGLIAYYIIATAEASANLARYDGIRYGYRSISNNIDSLVCSSRSEGFGDEVKLRILLGTYVLRSGFYDQYYVKAQCVRRSIRKMYDTVFHDVDAVLLPVFPVQAFRPSDMDEFQERIGDIFTAPANLTGLPSLAFPLMVSNGLPLGMQLMGRTHSELQLCNIARSISTDIGHPPNYPGACAWMAAQEGK